MLDSNGSFDNPFFQDKKIIKIDCKWKDQEYSKDAFGFTHAEYVCSFILKENPEAEIVLVPIVRKNKKSTVLDMIEGIETLIEEQVDIINLSMGDEYKYHKEIEEVCRVATEKGILIVAAYSNQKAEATYPASFPFVIGVRCLDMDEPVQVLEYDGKKNMTAARNSEGVQYRYTYDTKGNPQDVVIHHDRVSTSVMAGRSYYIRHRKSGKYIDVKDASNKDGAAVQQYEFSGSSEQKWHIEDAGEGYIIFKAFDGNGTYVLDIGTDANGAKAKLAAYANKDSQKFRIKPVGE